MRTNFRQKVALLYPGNPHEREGIVTATNRFAKLFEALVTAGIPAKPVIWHDDVADEVKAQLMGVQVVLVWCNPIEDGRRRDQLDAMLKDVLFETRDLPFGSDVHLISSLAQLHTELPERLRQGARVLKQHRGHSGIGVWRVEACGVDRLRVQHAQRGSAPQDMIWATLLDTLAPYFEPSAGGHMIDQVWEPRIALGMIRAYLVEDRVTGFGVQDVNALHPRVPNPEPRQYYGPELPEAQILRHLLESKWIQLLCERVGLARDNLPLLWDCDFMYGEPTTDGTPHFILCEINVSSVSPFPPSSVEPLVQAIQLRLKLLTKVSSFL